LEKVLKGLVVERTKAHAPYTHKLIDLAKWAGLELSKQQKEDLTEINSFNIAGRYNDYKQRFHKKCTSAYSRKYFILCQEFYLWLKKLYQEK